MSDATNPPAVPGKTIGFVGLGNMGAPMVSRLVAAGYDVVAYDTDSVARDRAAAVGARTVDDVRAVANGAGAVVLMLPSSDVVERVVHEADLLGSLASDTLLVDMGSSRPNATRSLAEQARARHIRVVDAPVSGGVQGALDGTLTIMVGGEREDVNRAQELLTPLGRQVLHVGPCGAGHLLKALNNLISATHLLVTSEALLVGQQFGLDPGTMLDAINGSSGRSGSSENKWPNFVLPETYDSGFGLRLMVKDMQIAVETATTEQVRSQLSEASVNQWSQAAQALPPDADHTEIVRWLRMDTSAP